MEDELFIGWVSQGAPGGWIAATLLRDQRCGGQISSPR